MPIIWIVAHSDILCKSLTPVLIGFSAEQQRHALNFIEALLVCAAAKHKTMFNNGVRRASIPTPRAT